MKWNHEIEIRHLFTKEKTPEAVSKSMTAIGEILKKDKWFDDFDLVEDFFVIDDIDEANDLLNEMYDYCDARRIWVKL